LDPARERNLSVLQAELLSEHGGDALGDWRVDYLLAATPDYIYNSLVSTRLAPQVGRHRVGQLAPSGSDVDDWVGLSREWRGQFVGQPPISFSQMRERWKQGWRFSLANLPAGAQVETERSHSVAILLIHSNKELSFASPEGAALSAVGQDRLLVFEGPLASAGRA
jgi:hypothetical protein